MIEVDGESAGERLDRFLARALGLSRGYVRRLLAHGGVTVDGRPAVKGAVLRAGERVAVEAFRHPDEGPAASASSLPLLETAGGLAAFDKPAGMATHPLDFEETDTALNAALARFPEMQGVGEGGVRSGVVHRLDRDTSGVLVFAHGARAWRRARQAFAQRTVEKRYVARVHGQPQALGEISLRLAHAGPRMRVVSRGGLPAITRIVASDARGDTSLVEIDLVTGVMHQIRVTLAHLGHPVVGDGLYGSPADEARHWLHARSIRIGDFAASSAPPPELR